MAGRRRAAGCRVTVLDPGLLPQERAETLRLLRRWPGIALVSAPRQEH